MTIADYDTEGTATDSVKYARNIGTDGASISYATQLAKNRSEEHTSELQSHHDLVCRLLLEANV